MPSCALPRTRPAQPPQKGGGAARLWPEVLLLLAVGAVAAGFRLYQLPAVPPGLHHDEAVNGLDILFTIPRSHPIFFEANSGREPLFIYLQAAAVHFLGPTVPALRLTSAAIGILTVLATCWLAREWFGRRVALLAGLGLAASFWHVDLSRVGLRGIAAPLFATLALALLWRGLRDGKALSFALAGLAVALGLYTYISGRLVPFLVLGVLLWEALRSGRRLLGRGLGIAALVVVAAVATAPLGLYFAQHLDDFLGRSQQVSIFNPSPTIEGQPDTFQDNLERNLGMFFVRGDDNPRHNLPGRPVFGPVAAPWLVLGLVVVTWRAIATLPVRKKRQASGPEPAGWLLIWLIGGLSLGALTQESPNYLRLTLMAPAVYVTWALGVAAAWQWLARRLGPAPSPVRALPVLLVLALLGHEVGQTYQGYFHDWAERADVYRAFDAGLAAAARHVEAAAAPDLPLFFYVDRSPTVLFLSPEARKGRWLQEYSNLLLLPRSGAAGALYVFASDAAASNVRRLYLSAFQPEARDLDPAGKETFAAYRLSADQVESLATPAVPLGRGFGGEGTGVELLGYTLDSTVGQPGGRLGLTLFWRQRGDAERVYAPYLHVVDDHGHPWGQDDGLGFAVGGWQEGDLFLSRHEWAIPPDAPPIAYHLLVGMAVRRFGWPPGPSEALGPPADLGQVRVDRTAAPPAAQPEPRVEHRTDAELGAGLRLVGYDAPSRPLKPGDVLPVDLLWQASAQPGRDVLVNLSLADGAGRVWATETGRPAYGEYPTSSWPAGTLLRDPRALTLPGDAPGGQSRLTLRTLDALTGEELGHARLGTVEVVEPPRSFELPAMQRRVDANFGGEIALRGFDLDRDALAPDGTLRLTLYWQALRAPTKNYTVFTHLLDAGDKVVAQQDNPPVGGTAPTLGWAPGQVIRDEYELKLRGEPESEELTLEVGLYDAATGERLGLVGESQDNRVILARLPVAPARKSAER